MKTSYLAIVCAIGFAASTACGPSQPATNADDGSGAAPTTSSDPAGGAGASDATGGSTASGSSAGGSSAGGSSAGGSSAGGGSSTGGSDAGGGGTGGSGAGGAGAGGGAPTPAEPPAKLVAAADAASGEKLYAQEHCDGCHGTKAKPNAKFPNLYKLKWDDKQIEKAFTLVKQGKSPMPPYGDKLNDKQIADIVAFVKKNAGK